MTTPGSSSSSMAPPGGLLYGLGDPPSIVFFQTLDYLAFSLVLVLFPVAMFNLFLVYLLVPYWMLRKTGRKTRRKAPRQRAPSSCRRCMKAVFLFVGKRLCVYTFPALFKLHKIHSKNGCSSHTREFMVFLDRVVDNSLAIVSAFCSIVFSIFYSSGMVFLQYFLVEKSGECQEKDNHDRPLFCYNTSSSPTKPNLPVDCANYKNVAEFQKFTIECYAISLPVGISIAFATALAVVKVATLGITSCVKVTEWYFKLTKNPPCTVPQGCCSRKCANGIYLVASCYLLLAVVPSVLSFFISFSFSLDSNKIMQPEISALLLFHLFSETFVYVPYQICLPLFYILLYLLVHCDKGQYASIVPDQRPLDPRDWDKESESPVTEDEHDEASMEGEEGNVHGGVLGEPEQQPLAVDIAPTYGSTVQSESSIPA